MRLFTSILLLFVWHFSIACSCKGKNSIETEYKSVNYVLVGTVVSSDTITLIDSNQVNGQLDSRLVRELPRLYIPLKHIEFVVARSFKGSFTQDTIHIYTGRTSSSCGFNFIVGESYLVYGNKETYYQLDDTGNYGEPIGNNVIWVNSCSRTKRFNLTEISKVEALK